MCGAGLQAGAPISIDAARTRTLPSRPMRTPDARRSRRRRSDAAIEHLASSRCCIGPTRNGQPIASQMQRSTTTSATTTRDQRQRPAHAGAPRGERSSHGGAFVGARTGADLSVPCRRGLWARSYSRRASASGLSSGRRRRAPPPGRARRSGCRPPARPSRAASAGWRWRCAASARRWAPRAGRDAPPARPRRRRARRRRCVPSRSAAASAASSTMPPRAMLASVAVGFISASSAAPTSGATRRCTARR